MEKLLWPVYSSTVVDEFHQNAVTFTSGKDRQCPILLCGQCSTAVDGQVEKDLHEIGLVRPHQRQIRLEITDTCDTFLAQRRCYHDPHSVDTGKRLYFFSFIRSM